MIRANVKAESGRAALMTDSNTCMANDCADNFAQQPRRFLIECTQIALVMAQPYVGDAKSRRAPSIRLPDAPCGLAGET
jgi:hypothetical protein